MTKANLRVPPTPNFKPGQRYRGVQGKIVDWVEHTFEEGSLHINVRFTDKTELCWRITARMAIEEADLADWTSGDYSSFGAASEN
jgi:hypothetical protein